MRYFVTGATGFLGRNLVPLLLARAARADQKVGVLVRESSLAKLTEIRRLAVGIGFCFVFFFALVRDRITHTLLKRKTLDERSKERVIFAGSGEETHALLEELDPEITEGWNVVDHFDLHVVR